MRSAARYNKDRQRSPGCGVGLEVGSSQTYCLDLSALLGHRYRGGSDEVPIRIIGASGKFAEALIAGARNKKREVRRDTSLR